MSDRRELPGTARITRFIHSKRDFSFPAGLPKVTAFEPDGKGEFSIAEVTNLSRGEVWALARHTLRDQPGRDHVVARAELAVAAVVGSGLSCFRDDVNFIGHGGIAGLPPLTDKVRLRDVARKLVEASLGDIPDDPITLS